MHLDPEAILFTAIHYDGIKEIVDLTISDRDSFFSAACDLEQQLYSDTDPNPRLDCSADGTAWALGSKEALLSQLNHFWSNHTDLVDFLADNLGEITTFSERTYVSIPEDRALADPRDAGLSPVTDPAELPTFAAGPRTPGGSRYKLFKFVDSPNRSEPAEAKLPVIPIATADSCLVSALRRRRFSVERLKKLVTGHQSFNPCIQIGANRSIKSIL